MRARRRGWAIVAALSITETTSWGVVYYGFPVFLKPMEAELGWSRAQLTGAFSLALLMQGIGAVLVGRWLDRHSPRGLMTVGSMAAAGLVWTWSRVRSPVAFYALWIALGAVMATILYEPAFTVVTKWFQGERRAALTVVTLVAGLASFIFLPIENRLITIHGWRHALVILAVVLAVITVPLHALVLRRAPEPEPMGAVAAEPRASARDAVRTTAFWFLAVAMVLASFVASALAVHQVAYLTERGYSSAFAAGLTGTLGAMQLPGRLLFAPLMRWLPRRVVTTIVFGSFAAGTALLAAGGGIAMLWVFVVVYGMGRGMTTLLRATLVGELFGSRHYGAIAGVLAACTTVATALGPFFAAFMHDARHSYGAVVWVLVGVAVLATVAASQVERHGPPESASTRARPPSGTTTTVGWHRLGQ